MSSLTNISIQPRLDQAKRQVAKVFNVVQTRSGISISISTITEMNLSMANAVAEQNAATNEITGNIVRISASAGRILNNMHGTEFSVHQFLEKTQSLTHTMGRFGCKGDRM